METMRLCDFLPGGTKNPHYAKVAFLLSEETRALRDAKRHTVDERGKERGRRNWLKRYGLTLERYEDMVREQNGVCFECGKPPAYGRLAVDHNHLTNETRHLLCIACNTLLGVVEKYFQGCYPWMDKYVDEQRRQNA